MPISIGKLSLYVAGAGIRPSSTVPICIDVGTDNKEFLEDPLYLGLRQPRVPEAEMHEFMEEFMHEMSVVFPELLIQFEDFATDKVCLEYSWLLSESDNYHRHSRSCQASGIVTLYSMTISKAQEPSFYLASSTPPNYLLRPRGAPSLTTVSSSLAPALLESESVCSS